MAKVSYLMNMLKVFWIEFRTFFAQVWLKVERFLRKYRQETSYLYKWGTFLRKQLFLFQSYFPWTLYGQASKQPKRCRSAILDPKGRAFWCVSGSLLYSPGSWLPVLAIELRRIVKYIGHGFLPLKD